MEQNEGREIYLNHYHGVDSLDHMIKITGNCFISQKYWHSPYLHAISMGIIAAYDMYHEWCDCGLDAMWKVEEKERMSFLLFCLMLSEQMLQYDPWNDQYAGYNKFRCFTQLHKKRRRSKDLSIREETYPDTGVFLKILKTAWELPWFCATIEELQKHFETIKKRTIHKI